MYLLQTLKSHLECIKCQSEGYKSLTEPARLRKNNMSSLRGIRGENDARRESRGAMGTKKKYNRYEGSGQH